MMKLSKPLAILLGASALIAGTALMTKTSQADNDMKNKTQSQEQHSTEHLDDMQKYVTVHDGTEPPFKNKYWDNHDPGIYVDVVTGEPLFSSTDKFDSGSGWPSFTKPITDHNIQTKADHSMGMNRTEVRSSQGDFHLGHLFDDGPHEFGGQRYCINSAALRFVPVADMEKEGYAEYLVLFENTSDKPETH